VRTDAGECAEGCYSNKQHDEALNVLLDVIGQQNDRLREIRKLSDDAVATNPGK